MKPLSLVLLVIILGCAAFLLHSQNFVIVGLGALRTNLGAGNDNAQGSNIAIEFDISVPHPGSDDVISIEDISNNTKTFVNTLIEIGNLIENSCKEKILSQERSLDELVTSARALILENNLISAQIEIEKMRWKNICGDDHAVGNRTMVERYEGIRRILLSEIANAYSINTD